MRFHKMMQLFEKSVPSFYEYLRRTNYVRTESERARESENESARARGSALHPERLHFDQTNKQTNKKETKWNQKEE